MKGELLRSAGGSKHIRHQCYPFSPLTHFSKSWELVDLMYDPKYILELSIFFYIPLKWMVPGSR